MSDLQESASSTQAASSVEASMPSATAPSAALATETKSMEHPTVPAQPPKSKNQIKRDAKWAKRLAENPNHKREQRAKQKAGRKRQAQLRREQNLPPISRGRRGHKHAAEQYALMESPGTVSVAIDCGFESIMGKQELSSVVTQVVRSFAANTRTERPVKLHITGIEPGSQQATALGKLTGVESYAWYRQDVPLLEAFKDRKQDLVYLTADSDVTLDELDPSAVYVIGGIVDHNRLKRHTYNHATKLGIKTAKLPLSEHMSSGLRNVLTILQMVEILAVKQHKPWPDAFKTALPDRWKWEEAVKSGEAKAGEEDYTDDGNDDYSDENEDDEEDEDGEVRGDGGEEEQKGEKKKDDNGTNTNTSSAPPSGAGGGGEGAGAGARSKSGPKPPSRWALISPTPEQILQAKADGLDRAVIDAMIAERLANLEKAKKELKEQQLRERQQREEQDKARRAATATSLPRVRKSDDNADAGDKSETAAASDSASTTTPASASTSTSTSTSTTETETEQESSASAPIEHTDKKQRKES